MSMDTVQSVIIPMAKIEANKGQIEGLPKNPRFIKNDKFKRLVKSVKDNPEMMGYRELLVYPHGSKYVIIGGNMRFHAMKELGIKEAPCKVIDKSATIDQLKAYVIKDNNGFGEWDLELLANEWDTAMLADWGVEPAEWNTPTEDNHEETEEDEYERKKREFKERMEAGELDEDDEEYQEFLDKFKAKKTTDDCYTPLPIYETIAGWVEEEYGVKRKDFERPFCPGGDYRNFVYPEGCVVVDNPPFSILAEILDFYAERKIKYFLFAPTLTLFSGASSRDCCALPAGVTVTYENGANVNTSFLTNLEDPALRVRSTPLLYRLIKEANDEVLKSMHKELPKYSYPDNVITASKVAYFSKYGVDFKVTVDTSTPINNLDSQKESGKSIYGKGYLVSEKAAAEKAAAEKAAAEKAAAMRWKLSDREKEIIRRLSKND